MNLSPDWVAAFATAGIESVHWSTIGDPRAEDTEIIEYARSNEYIVFTHDLDFGTLLAFTQAKGPSVIQVRAAGYSTSPFGSDGIVGHTRKSDIS